MQGRLGAVSWVSLAPSALWALAVAAGCGGEDGGKTTAQGGTGGGGGAGGVSIGGSGGANQQAAGSAGKGGAGSAGMAGQGGGPSGPPVPRVENTDGPSALDMPSQGLSDDGKCPRAEVFCNGMCLAADLAVAGNCTVLKLGLNQTADLALTADALYYTARNQEILKMDLASGTHTSLVRGLTFVQGLAVDGDWLYFSTDVPDGFFERDARRVALSGGDVTVISPQFGEPIEVIIPLPDKLLLAVGNFDYELLTIPKEGGQGSPFGGIDGATSLVLGDGTLYYRSDGICSTSIASPMPDQKLNSEFSNARLILEGDHLYYALGGVYMRQPIAGGMPEEVQPLADTYVWGRSPTHVILTQVDAADETVTHVLTMPIAGGTPENLLTIESQELQDVAADATNLYLAVGVIGNGAILRAPLAPVAQ